MDVSILENELVYLPKFIKMVITQLVINSSPKLGPLYSVHTELSIYAKNTILIKNFPKVLFLEHL